MIGLALLSPRTIVKEVLWNAVTSTPFEFTYNKFTILSTLFISHDVHYQVPSQPKNPSDKFVVVQKVVNPYYRVNPGTFIEFAIFYRALHYYLHDR